MCALLQNEHCQSDYHAFIAHFWLLALLYVDRKLPSLILVSCFAGELFGFVPTRAFRAIATMRLINNKTGWGCHYFLNRISALSLSRAHADRYRSSSRQHLNSLAMACSKATMIKQPHLCATAARRRPPRPNFALYGWPSRYSSESVALF